MTFYIGNKVRIGELAEKLGDIEFAGETGTYEGCNEQGLAKVKIDNSKLLQPIFTRVPPECLERV